MPLRLPLVQHFGLFVPSSTLADKGEGEQFGITAHGLGAGMGKLCADLLADVIYKGVDPHAKVFKMRYHESAFRYEQSLFGDKLLYVTKAQLGTRYATRMAC